MIQRAVVSEYISTNFGTSEDFLFEKHPSFGVFRHPISGKWFGVLMEIPRSKLYVSEADDEDIVILNVKINPELGEILRNKPGIYAAYHMTSNTGQFGFISVIGIVRSRAIGGR
ncbi:MmcQ/YjbR family DNA-binding protein [Enterococcus diestrammenae]|uniref:MmcQ/YjbR family DNA-binding protein n=1 Tax=Enterococcus diestrammenae TaxID=1155073 RepID=UPI001959F050